MTNPKAQWVTKDELRAAGAEGAFRNSEREATDVDLCSPEAAVAAFKAAFFDSPEVQAADIKFK